MNEYLQDLGRRAKAAAAQTACAGESRKNEALLNMAEALMSAKEELFEANLRDIETARERPASFIDRMRLDEKRLNSICEGLRQVAALSDPVGEIIGGGLRPNGLEIIKKRVPLGVIGIVYEARPNVTADAAALCLKSGNAVILRGSSETLNSNKVICAELRRGLERAGMPADAVLLVEQTDRETASELMRLREYIDVLIPRGGAGLIKAVVENARIPVIETGTGVCHSYVDDDADLEMAAEIAVNAKVSRPSVCNSMETLLVSRAVAAAFLPVVCEKLRASGVELRGCEATRALIKGVSVVSEEDWSTEYNDLILSVKVVSGIDEAVEHINRYGTRHSEAIITENVGAARSFCERVDAACVYVNASTRFSDGFEFGLGAEIGISNQKLHARGPMGLRELTTCKYVINGSGQIRL